jgi:hypothetical protein
MSSADVVRAARSNGCLKQRALETTRKLEFHDFTCPLPGDDRASQSSSILRVEYSKKGRAYRVTFSQQVNMGFEDFHTRAYAVYSDYTSGRCSHAEQAVLEPIAALTWCYSRSDDMVFAVSRDRTHFQLTLADRSIRDGDLEFAREPKF